MIGDASNSRISSETNRPDASRPIIESIQRTVLFDPSSIALRKRPIRCLGCCPERDRRKQSTNDRFHDRYDRQDLNRFRCFTRALCVPGPSGGNRFWRDPATASLPAATHCSANPSFRRSGVSRVPCANIRLRRSPGAAVQRQNASIIEHLTARGRVARGTRKTPERRSGLAPCPYLSDDRDCDRGNHTRRHACGPSHFHSVKDKLSHNLDNLLIKSTTDMKPPVPKRHAAGAEDKPLKEPLYIRLIQASVMLLFILVLLVWIPGRETKHGENGAMMILAGLGVARLSAQPGSGRRNWIYSGLMGAALIMAVVQRTV